MPIDLLTSPRSREEHLGLPMPDDRHAVSACLPLWSHNIGYEEGDPAVVDRLQAAYPRFCLHPLVRQVCSKLVTEPGQCGLPFASLRSAKRAVEYAGWHGCPESKLVEFPGQQAWGVVVPEEFQGILKQYWQHAGEIVSSRVAERILLNQPTGSSPTPARDTVRERIARLHGVRANDVFLFSSGMAAVAAAWRAARHLRPATGTCQFGFPYVDTLKIQERFPQASRTFYPLGSAADLESLEQHCRDNLPAAIFCEVPANPLLLTPDLARLQSIARDARALLVIDDTLAACGNIQALPYADMVVTSLTKYFSGYGNVLAGAFVLNGASDQYADLREFVSGTSRKRSVIPTWRCWNSTAAICRTDSGSSTTTQFGWRIF
ncbi:MAG: PLP-dependent transferase [Planctomycetaceae bacterium]